jgi:Holliday junction resolvasome RuvABC endonuclease subunit
MIIIGNDIGLNTNAIVVYRTEKNKLKLDNKYFKNLSSLKSEGAKFKHLYNQYLEIFDNYKSEDILIVYEQPIMQGKTGGLLNGTVALLKMAINVSLNDKCKIIPVSPKTLKKTITTSGIANKKDMRYWLEQKEINENLNFGFTDKDWNNDHLVDALACCYYGVKNENNQKELLNNVINNKSL